MTMILISMTSMVESTGVFFALGDIVGRKIEADDLKRGYRAEGLAVVLGGLFNTFPYTTFSQNVGLVQLSGIKTRKPGNLFGSLLGYPWVAAENRRLGNDHSGTGSWWCYAGDVRDGCGARYPDAATG